MAIVAAIVIALIVFAPNILMTIAAIIFGLLLFNLFCEGIADLFSKLNSLLTNGFTVKGKKDVICNKPIYYHRKK